MKELKYMIVRRNMEQENNINEEKTQENTKENNNSRNAFENSSFSVSVF